MKVVTTCFDFYNDEMDEFIASVYWGSEEEVVINILKDEIDVDTLEKIFDMAKHLETKLKRQLKGQR